MKTGTPEERAKRRTDEYIGLLWHVASFVIVVPFLFLLDWRFGPETWWAYWVAIPWAVGLLFHVIAYTISDRVQERAYERFLAREKANLKDKKP